MKRTIRVFSLLLAAVMLLSAQALATEPAQEFTDVTKQDYFYDAVNWAVEKEITSGVSKDVFAPNRDCTRADFVTFLWRAAGKPVVNYAMSFSDVKESSYYAEAVRWAASLGIVTGLSKNTFGAANAVTREQAVTMLWRFAKQQGFDTTQGGMAIREYTDYDSLSEYAREAMAWAVNTEILKGSNNRLLPDAACTRAQLVTLLYRLESQTTDMVNYSGDVTGWMYAPESKDTAGQFACEHRYCRARQRRRQPAAGKRCSFSDEARYERERKGRRSSENLSGRNECNAEGLLLLPVAAGASSGKRLAGRQRGSRDSGRRRRCRF